MHGNPSPSGTDPGLGFGGWLVRTFRGSHRTSALSFWAGVSKGPIRMNRFDFQAVECGYPTLQSSKDPGRINLSVLYKVG
jgi:hypothetical protein